MDIYGYLIVGKASTVKPDYLPSLIGIGEDQEEPLPSDTYFEGKLFKQVTITDIAPSRWYSYDSLPSDTRDPIVVVKGEGVHFCIPLAELTTQVKEANNSLVLSILSKKFGIN